MKILSIAGARPNFMKLASIAYAIDKHNEKHSSSNRRIIHKILHTGQHYDANMSHSFFEDLCIPKPDINLEVGSASHAAQTSRIIMQFEPVLLAEEPDVLIVVGDVNSTIACALVASKIQYKNRYEKKRPLIAHIEAGLRSFDHEMPEEINRILTDALSDFLFITEESGEKNLINEGINSKKIHFVGNVMIDTLINHIEKSKKLNTLNAILDNNRTSMVDGNKYAIVTLHRPSNVDNVDNLKPLLDCIVNISKKIPIIFPIHPRTRNKMEQYRLYDSFVNNNSIIISDPLGYLDFLNLLSDAKLILTDSGGIQEETTFLQIPCITLRENTERPVTVSLGTNYLVGTNPDKILESAQLILNGKGKKGRIPNFWDGKAGERILSIITQQGFQ